MRDFVFHAPTEICFGREQVSHLAELSAFGSRALLVYGGGSIKRNGIYDDVMGVLAGAGIEVEELAGVEPNPRIATVRRGVALCRERGVDMVLAVGGGSAIDCSKAIAAGVPYEGDPWDLVMDHSLVKAALPVACVVTLAATGSEMNGNAVISNPDIPAKLAVKSPLLCPRIAILDPTYTLTVPRRQTAAGVADMMSHTFENYFTLEPACDVQRRMAEGLLRTMIKYGPIALAHPDDYDARANLMWAATHAINGIVSQGSAPAWSCHPIEHELSAYYDITHGEGLAVVTPVWMEHVLGVDTVVPFAEYGRNVWGLVGADDMAVAHEAIACTRRFLFQDLGIAPNLRGLGIPDESHFGDMADHMWWRTEKSFVPLSRDDVVAILHDAF